MNDPAETTTSLLAFTLPAMPMLLVFQRGSSDLTPMPGFPHGKASPTPLTLPIPGTTRRRSTLPLARSTTATLLASFLRVTPTHTAAKEVRNGISTSRQVMARIQRLESSFWFSPDLAETVVQRRSSAMTCEGNSVCSGEILSGRRD